MHVKLLSEFTQEYCEYWPKKNQLIKKVDFDYDNIDELFNISDERLNQHDSEPR